MSEIVKQVDQGVLDAWGELSGDGNPLHVDPAFAAGTRYGGTILHGHLTIAWLNEWALRQWGVAWLSRGEIRGLRFRRPLRPGLSYRVHGEFEPGGGAASVTVVTPEGEAGVLATMRLRAAE